ncbi:MAG: DNA topoisomerase IB [Chloroflexota bacterium]
MTLAPNAVVTGPDHAIELLAKPDLAAKAAGLRHISPVIPGIRREKNGESFRYFDQYGKPVKDTETLIRIKHLVIPPVWTDIWISPLSNGHLQAVGRDVKGRKQYRYHNKWRQVRDEAKYGHTIAFARALPAVRRRVQKDIALPGLPRDKVLATVVRLLEMTLIRVGNDEYARDNNSYGLTTMRDRHAKIQGSRVEFSFVGKSGKKHAISVDDKHLAGIVRRCRDIPGYDLFQYYDENGESHAISSGDVNDYIRSITGQDFTAKDFRTWTGTLLAATALKVFDPFGSQAEAKRNVVAAIEGVSQKLGNTPSVCRKCYVHPDILASYLDGDLPESLVSDDSAKVRGLGAEESVVLAFLERRFSEQQKKSA